MKQIALFVLGLLGIHLLLLFAFEVKIDSKQRIDREKKQFLEASENAKTLIMGHSKPKHAWLMDSIPSASNFCLGGERIVRTYYKLKTLMNKTKNKSRVLILPFDAPYISLEDINQDFRSFYWSNYQSYLEVGREAKAPWTYVKVFCRAKIVPYQWQVLFWLKSLCGTWMGPVDPAIYEKANEEQKEAMAKLLIDKYQNTQSFKHEVAVKYLSKIIDLAKSHEVTIYFIRYPETKYYQNALGHFDIQDFEQDQWLEPYKDDIRIFDMRDILQDCPDCFKDLQHVNQKGSILFTSRAWKKLQVSVITEL